MARAHVQPPIDEPKFKRRAKVTKTVAGNTRTVFDVVEDDPTLGTRDGNAELFLSQALKRFTMAADAEFYNRTEGLLDVLMVDGEGQWDDDIRGRRQRKKRPCLTMNRFRPMIKHVANEQRMARPSIQVDPVGGGADPDSAAIRQGIIRHIEIASNAETIYDIAFERMIEKGWSWFRIVTDYESPLSHNQVVRIEGFSNDFCIYSDPTAEDPTRKDMKWAFVVYDMPRGQFRQEHPTALAAGLTSFASVGDDVPGWITTETVRVCEYYYIEDTPAMSVRLVGGEGYWEDEMEERAGLWYDKAQLDAMDHGFIEPEDVLPIPVEVDEDQRLIKRKSFKPTLKWAKISAVDILDGNAGDSISENTGGREIPGKRIPLVMVSGEERVVNGQRRMNGMVRSNRDAQRMYNYSVSAFVEMVALAPKSPFIAAAGQIEEFKKIWDTSNEENWPYLPYTPQTVNQQIVPPPQRQNIEPPVMAIIQAIREFDNDLKIGFNIFDPSMGAPKSDQSGRAVTALQARSDSANMNWLDNMRRAMIYAGELILERIPIVYDSARIVPIIRPDNQREEVLINQEFARKKDGKLVNYDMAVGTYSCTVSIGEFASKRQEAVRSLADIAKNVPQVALHLLPLILDNMDTPMAKDAAEIVRRVQPVELQEPGSPEQMQAQMRALMQQHDLLTQALEAANETIRTKQIEATSKEKIASLQAQSQVAIAAAKLGSVEGIKALTLEYQRITDELNRTQEREIALEDNAVKKIAAQKKPAAAKKKK